MKSEKSRTVLPILPEAGGYELPRERLTAIRAEIDRFAAFADSHPLRNPGDPAQIDLLIEIALANPFWNTREIGAQYLHLTGTPAKVSIHHLLRRYRLLKADGREECQAAVMRHWHDFCDLLWNPNAQRAGAAYGVIHERRSRTQQSQPVVARLVLRGLAEQLVRSDIEAEVAVARSLHQVLAAILPPTTEKLYVRIARAIANQRQVVRPESADETLTDLIQQVDALEGQELSESTDLDASLEENMLLRSALFGLRQELVGLQDRLRVVEGVSEAQAIGAFLRNLNSPLNNNLLDNIVFSGCAIDRLLQQGWVPDPAELEGVVYSLKLLAGFLQQIGVKQMQEVGSRSKIGMEDLALISYIGSEFTHSRETKWVQFRTPGWSYKDQIVSMPQAVEISPPVDLEVS